MNVLLTAATAATAALAEALTASSSAVPPVLLHVRLLQPDRFMLHTLKLKTQAEAAQYKLL
jgi:hypothetical protein